MPHDHTSFLNTLTEFSSRLLASYDVDSILAELAERLTQLFGLAGSGVMVAAPDGRLEFVAAVPEEFAILERQQAGSQDGPCATAYRSGRTVVVPDLAAEPHRWPTYVALAGTIGVRAVAGLPMCLAGRSVGAVNLYSAAPRQWSESDLVAARVLANLATSFLINASLFDEQRRLTDQLQAALDSRIVIEQAKGVLSADRGISVDEAFERIRSHARARGQRIRDVAAAIVGAGSRLG
ncbi:GAF and ANTAR domain-containing protein [Nocardioides sp. Root140]|uniref:GAF and ANTAR domain-containing protein n=1 Tax=Nocardioides sp. Root140 TaxID=1736460 RepID=UPI0006F8E57E|nr:GAF and ANTAR domain-containing protein [Nocardioides sp. Root140]KQY56492.1 hypothetical protein ASD30_09125 [Nocardioides sp. Root140]